MHSAKAKNEIQPHFLSYICGPFNLTNYLIICFFRQNYAITDAVQKIASEYKCKPIEGMLSHQLKQFKIDGEKTIIQNPNEAQRKEHEKCEFALHEVYAIDVLISTGEGVGREKDTKVSIFKKTDENYQLKLKASRALITEVSELVQMNSIG